MPVQEVERRRFGEAQTVGAAYRPEDRRVPEVQRRLRLPGDLPGTGDLLRFRLCCGEGGLPRQRAEDLT